MASRCRGVRHGHALNLEENHMRYLHSMVGASLGIGLSVLLVACGGGGGGADAPDTPVSQNARVSGTITGLASDNTITMVLNQDQTQTFAADGTLTRAYVFSGVIPWGSEYQVEIVRQPINQLCEIRNPSGVADRADANVSSVNVFCFDTLLNDTGVTQGQDGEFGRDAAAQAGTLDKLGQGRVGFDFTRVCAGGAAAGSNGCPSSPAPGSAANEWACTQDNVTGLLWQLEPQQGAVAWNGVQAQVDAANSANLCGRDDWRAPTVLELASMVDSGAAFDAPAIDATGFPMVQPATYWTGEVAQPAGDAARWAVEFDNGSVTFVSESDAAFVMAVSGDPHGNVSQERFEIRTPAVFIDHGFGLMWQATDVTGDWDAALGLADQVNADAPAGFSDWRLPNRNELASLVDRARKGPAIDATLEAELQPAIRAVGYWSSSAFSSAPGGGDFAWLVNFDGGDVLPGLTGGERRVMLVRNRFRGED